MATAMSTTTAASEAAMSAKATMPRETVTPALMDVGHFSMTTPATVIPTVVPTTPAPIGIGRVVVVGWVVIGHRSAVANLLHASGQQKAQGQREE